MIRTLVDIGAELVMVMSIVLLDWPMYVNVVSLSAHPWISAPGCLGSIGKLMRFQSSALQACSNICHGGSICWIFL
ncbi:hypothetical protein CFC21_110425, partial [Triticum aestivum]